MPEQKMNNFKSFKTKYTSDIFPGAYEFERLDIILKNRDEASVACLRLQRDAVLPYFSTVKAFFNFLRPYILLSWNKRRMEQIKANTERLWIESLNFYSDYQNNENIDFPLGLVKRIDELDADLNMVKQLIGFGLRISKEEGAKTVMRRYLKSSGDKVDKRFERTIPIK